MSSQYCKPTGSDPVWRCPVCAQRFNDQTIGTIHIRRDHRDKLSPYLLEYQPTDPKEDQA